MNLYPNSKKKKKKNNQHNVSPVLIAVFLISNGESRNAVPQLLPYGALPMHKRAVQLNLQLFPSPTVSNLAIDFCRKKTPKNTICNNSRFSCSNFFCIFFCKWLSAVITSCNRIYSISGPTYEKICNSDFSVTR